MRFTETGAAGAAAPAPLRRSGARAGEAVVLLVAALATAVFAAALVRRPAVTAGVLIVLALAAIVLLGRRRFAALTVRRIVWGLVLLIPLTALLGPALALPALPQLFAFRVITVVVAYLVFTLALLARPVLRFGARTYALLFALWYGWLLVSLLWAPDKAAGLRYLFVLAFMFVVMGAMAVAGKSDRSLRALCWVLAAGFVLILGFSTLEARFGIRLPTSKLLDGPANQQYAVTSVFHNQNDLATFIAVSWPFLLAPLFMTRRLLWRVLAIAGMGLALFALLRSGSRSSLLAIALETFVLVIWFGRLGARLDSRKGRVIGAVLAVVLIAGAAYLLFNNSDSTMLRQFRLESLLANVQSGTGSGNIRVNLLRRGLGVAGQYFMLGAGPGNAEVVLGSGLTALGITNLHNWWLEVLVDGGLPALCLQALIFFGLAAALWRVARTDRDPLTGYLAVAGFTAFVGMVIGALGPSSAVHFTPMWMLWGLAMAVVSRHRLRVEDAGRPPTPTALEAGPEAAP